MINQVTIEGYVCKGAETRSTGNGREVTKFTLNCPRRRNVNGQWQSEPRFIRCQYWHGDGRDFRAPQIAEGARLVVTGDLGFEEWEGRDGQKRTQNPVNVRELVTVAPREEGAAAAARGPQGSRRDDAPYDEDIPF